MISFSSIVANQLPEDELIFYLSEGWNLLFINFDNNFSASPLYCFSNDELSPAQLIIFPV